MEVVGFLVALVLLIPTYGLSLLVYFGFLVIRGVLRANARMNYANRQQALREVRDAYAAGSVSPTIPVSPSWLGNRDEEEIFSTVIIKACDRKGIPSIYVKGLFAQSEFRELLLAFVGNLERQGSSFIQQQIEAADFIETAWNRLSEENKLMIEGLGSLKAPPRGTVA